MDVPVQKLWIDRPGSVRLLIQGAGGIVIEEARCDLATGGWVSSLDNMNAVSDKYPLLPAFLQIHGSAELMPLLPEDSRYRAKVSGQSTMKPPLS